ncbi:DUF2202 domain-containing protein [Draconibacterium sp.]
MKTKHHLRAFVRDLNNRDIDYQPRILTTDQFNDIINK